MRPYYEDEWVTLYHGDAHEVLPGLDVPDAVVTDPPYGIAKLWTGGRGHGWGPARAKSRLRNQWDQEPPDLQFVLRLGAPTIVWGGNHFPLPPRRGWLVWRKEVNPTLSLGDAELAWTNIDTPVRVFDHPRSKLTGAKVPEHPTTKPMPLMEWCLGFVPDARAILDPFAGSGTTLVAAKNLGRNAIGIEIEEKYCAIAAERLSQATLPLYETLNNGSEITTLEHQSSLFMEDDGCPDGSQKESDTPARSGAAEGAGNG